MEYNHAYFAGKNALVTGAASGVGLALAEELLASNAAKVVLADINEQNLAARAQELRDKYGDHVKAIVCDVTNEAAVQQMIAEAQDYFDGQFDLLFNNAGAAFVSWFEDINDTFWQKAFDLNFYSAVYAMRAVLPIMKAQGSGQIINIISGIAFTPMSYSSAYAATKAALNAVTIALRTEYWDDGIKISSATPGTTATAIWGDAKPPESAQTPQQSASRILNGVANNDRIILGDDSDVSGATWGSNPAGAEKVDEYLLNVARQRRAGNLTV